MVSITQQYLCCEDLSNIENYEKAMKDDKVIWHIHHRFETDRNMSRQELIDKDLYKNRPANELIFLSPAEHRKLHSLYITDEMRNKMSLVKKGKHLSEEHKRKIGEGGKGRILSEETKRKMSESAKGRVISEEQRRKISKTLTGRLGSKHSEETKQHLREVNLGKHHSEETKRKLSEIMKSKGSLKEETKKKISDIIHSLVWINNGEVNKRVHKNDLESFLSKGFVKGKVKK